MIPPHAGTNKAVIEYERIVAQQPDTKPWNPQTLTGSKDI
jgi:hypothetical protein